MVIVVTARASGTKESAERIDARAMEWLSTTDEERMSRLESRGSGLEARLEQLNSDLWSSSSHVEPDFIRTLRT